MRISNNRNFIFLVNEGQVAHIKGFYWLQACITMFLRQRFYVLQISFNTGNSIFWSTRENLPITLLNLAWFLIHTSCLFVKSFNLWPTWNLFVAETYIWDQGASSSIGNQFPDHRIFSINKGKSYNHSFNVAMNGYCIRKTINVVILWENYRFLVLGFGGFIFEIFWSRRVNFPSTLLICPLPLSLI